MAVLIAQNLSKYWGVDLLFRGISFLLNPGEKMALVGRNGTGKTTLLRMLMGRMEYDEGSIHIPGGARVGYLSQDPDFTPGRTLLAEAQSIFAYLQKWEKDLRHLEERMGKEITGDELQLVMAEYTKVTAQFEAAGGYSTQARTKSVLFGLGFSEVELSLQVELLSGGQKVRLGLAKLLLEEPDLMLLDEPTNHLDLLATEWLEGYFKSMKSTAILVSHDRYFLDAVINRTLEIEQNQGELYHGNYSYYVQEKQRRAEATLSQFERQQKEMERLRLFYEKWRSTPSRKDQAMSRKRQLDKMQPLAKPMAGQRSMKLTFNMDFESGEDVLKVEHLAKAYDSKLLFSGVNLKLYKGERVALVGPNGVGKSTFLKIIHGLIEQDQGTIFWGVGIQRGYFSQDLDDLDASRTCLEEMLEIPGFTKLDAHSLLGRFLFSGDDAHKRIAQCSGGERNRLILAKLMVAGANVLLLDEPTNHLDLDSKVVLEESLSAFPGTVILVSHDRFFVDAIATRIWEFSADGVQAYEGNYSDYKAEKARMAALVVQSPTAPTSAAPIQELGAAQPESAHSFRQRKEERKEERKAAEAIKRLEEQIQQMEARRTDLEGRLADPDIYKTASGREAAAEYNAIGAELEQLYLEWERALQ